VSDTDSIAATSFASQALRSMPGKNSTRIIEKIRSILKMGLYELNGSWKTPCTRRVVLLQAPAVQRRDVGVVE